MATAAHAIDDVADFTNPNVVKVVLDAEVMAGATSACEAVPSPGVRVPESVGSACTWNGWEKKCGWVKPVSPPPPWASTAVAVTDQVPVTGSAMPVPIRVVPS